MKLRITKTWTIVLLILRNFEISAYNAQECGVLGYFGKNKLCHRSRPVSCYSKAVEVYTSIQLYSIHTLDEKQQTLRTSVWLEAIWKDNNVTWNKYQFGNVDSFLLPATEIWIPDICIINELSDDKCLKMDDNDNVLVKSNGQIFLWKGKEIKSQCQMDITKYPFDKQECAIRVGTHYSTDETVRLKGSHEVILMQNYQQNGVWEVLKTSVIEQRQNYVSNFTEVHFVITMKRKPLYYIYNVVLPVVLLSMLNIFSFFLPIESGDKISFSVSVFLSLAIFMSFISGSLPEQSDEAFHFGTYVFIELLICAATIVLEVLVIRIFHRQNKCKVGRPYVLLLPKRAKECTTEITNNRHLDNNIDAQDTSDIEKVTQRFLIKEWEIIARRLDIYFCVIVTLVNILSLLSYIASVLEY